MAGEMSVVRARDGECSGFYTLSNWLDNLSEGMLFRRSEKILGALKYFGLYTFALRMGTGPV